MIREERRNHLRIRPGLWKMQGNERLKNENNPVIDRDGFRPNVGIILVNDENRLFWGRRVGQDAWQFPQGGIQEGESPEEAMFRELEEEVGLKPHQVKVLGCTKRWLRYRLPKKFIRRNAQPLCIGQKQRWFLLQVICDESGFCLDSSEKPEFDDWRWVKYWQPVKDVIYFKRRVYQRALEELAPLIFPDARPVSRSRSNYLRQQRR
jgi:putative (di)nucleoside polyphosphate hydrolase